MATTPGDILERFRREVDDPEVPGGNVLEPDEDSLWKDAEIFGYMNEAQERLAEKTHALLANASISVVADEPFVDAPVGLLEIFRARLGSRGRALGVRNQNELSEIVRSDYGIQGNTAWEDLTGPPEVIVADVEPGRLRLVPTPTEADTLHLNYIRFPTEPIVRRSSKLEFTRASHVRAILHWMKKLAYEKQDADALDFRRAEGFGAQFERLAEEIYSEHHLRRRRVGTVRYGGL